MEDHVIVNADPGRPQRKRTLAAVVLLLIVAAAGGWYYFATRPHPGQVVKRDIVGLIPVNAEIVVPPSAQANIGAPFRAPVEKVNVSVGQHVRKGDVLIQLSVPNAEAVHEQSKATLKLAETAYANALSQYSATIGAAQTQLANARAAEIASRRVVVNPDGTRAAAPDPTQATAARIAAEQALQAAVAQRDSAVAPYRQQLEAAREANRQARAGEKMGYVRTPITGTVLALNAQPGREVGVDPKVPVATVVDLSAIQLQAPLDQRQAGYAKPGTPVRISVPELANKEYEGKVTRLTSQVDAKLGGLVKENRFVAVIDFKNADAAVRPGMKPQAALKLGEVRNALAVPAEAVDTDASGRPVVQALRGGHWQPVVVQTGITDGRYVEVKSGVKAGETIKVTPDALHAGSLPFGK